MVLQLQCSVIGLCWMLSILHDVLANNYLNSLPIYDGCVWADSELGVFVLEKEPVELQCPSFEQLISDARLTPEHGYTFHIAHNDTHTLYSNHGNHRGGRLRRDGWSLWLLPSQPSDSGTYSCVVRNATFCLKANLSLSVYPSGRADMEMMSYVVPPVTPGHDAIISCPTDDFNTTTSPRWYKDRSGSVLPVGRGRYHSQWGEFLLIKHFSAADTGFYTCRVTVNVFSTLYTISRISRVYTTGEAAPTLQPTTLSTSTHTPDTVVGYPHILSPTNNSVFESHFGSSLVLRCTVATKNQLAAFTLVTWLVDGQSVEESSLASRAFQRQMRVTIGLVEVDLIILEVKEEDSWAEFRCVAQNTAGSQEVFAQIHITGEGDVWLVVGVLCGSCFVCVLCVFLYHLLRPRKLKQRDYFLTRQDSVF